MSNRAERSGRFKGFFLLLAFVVNVWGGWVCMPPQALCDPKGEEDGKASVQVGKEKRSANRSTKRSLRMEEIEIHGDVEKPKTMFVIPRTPLRYSRQDHEKDYTNEILGPVSKQWVEDTQRWREAIPPP